MIERWNPDQLVEHQAQLSEAYRQFEGRTTVANPSHFVNYWHDRYAQGIGQIFACHADGHLYASLGGVVGADMYDGILTAVELFWNKQVIAPFEWYRLFDVYEEWARERNAKRIHLSRWFVRGGCDKYFTNILHYRPSEVHYVKEL